MVNVSGPISMPQLSARNVTDGRHKFVNTRKPLRMWFLAMWFVTSQKNGVGALGLQRVLGLGSYETAWTWLHKLRRAMVRPSRENLTGVVEVDEIYVGGPEEGMRGRQTESKAIVAVAAEKNGRGIGRIRLRRVMDVSADSLLPFVKEAVTPGSLVHTDGWSSYSSLAKAGYKHQVNVINNGAELAHEVLPRVHMAASLLKRWLIGTHQGGVQHQHLDYYLDEFAFRFNRRRSKARGLLFHRLAQQAAAVGPPHITLSSRIKFDLFRNDVPEAFVGNVARMFEVNDEVEDVPAAPPVVLIEILLIADLDQIKLDRVMKAIDGRVETGDVPQKPAVIGLQRFAKRRQHKRNRIGHAKRLARCVGKRDGGQRRCSRKRDIARLGIASAWKGRGEFGAQPCQRVKQRQDGEGENKIEKGMEGRDRCPSIGDGGRKPGCDIREKRQRNDAADGSDGKVADGKLFGAGSAPAATSWGKVLPRLAPSTSASAAFREMTPGVSDMTRRTVATLE